MEIKAADPQHDLVLACFQRMLARQFDVETAMGPFAALEAIADHGPFAVIVSDMRMPGMNGVQLLEKAKNLSVQLRREFTGQGSLVQHTVTTAGRKMAPRTRLRAKTTQIEVQGEYKATDKDG